MGWQKTQLPLLMQLLLLAQLAVVQSSSPGGRVVCTTPYYPVTQCSNSLDATGYEVELFKRAADRLYRGGNLEWAPGNWTFQCWDNWDLLMAELEKAANDNRTCDVVVAGVSATPERKAKGLQFSYPTLASGRLIMVYMDSSMSMWSFLEPFEPGLWLAWLATSCMMGLLLLLSESRWQGLLHQPRPALHRAAGIQWGTVALLLRVAGHVSPRSTGGRLMLAGYAFLAFILANLYISSSTALLSRRLVPLGINSMEDLVNQPVGLFIDDVGAFQRFALQDLHVFKWANEQDEQDMLAALRNGVVRALVLDAPWVRFMAASHCEYFVVGDTVLPVSLGFAFPVDTAASYLSLFDAALLYLEESGATAALAHQWLQPEYPCHAAKGDPKETIDPTVTLQQVSGLWVMWAACVGGCLLWNGTAFLLGQVQRSRAQLAMHERDPSAGGLRGRPGHKPGTQQPAGGLHSSAVGPLGPPTSHDEALQELRGQLAEVDTLVRHMPFVIAASLDARLADLKAHLAAVQRAQRRSAAATETDGLLATSEDVPHGAPLGAGRPSSNLSRMATGSATGNSGSHSRPGSREHPSTSKGDAAGLLAPGSEGAGTGLSGNGQGGPHVPTQSAQAGTQAVHGGDRSAAGDRRQQAAAAVQHMAPGSTLSMLNLVQQQPQQQNNNGTDVAGLGPHGGAGTGDAVPVHHADASSGAG